MKVILIEEARFSEILTILESKAEGLKVNASNLNSPSVRDPVTWNAAVDETYRRIRFNLVRWMQSHGASTLS